jgi:hypothetical protein
MNTSFELFQDRLGVWQLRLDGETYSGVTVVRAFPIGAPDEAVSVLSAEGHELLWLDAPLNLPEGLRQSVLAALQAREFMPEIQRVDGVSSFTTPSTWSVQTNRGFTQFVLRGEEDIRRLSGQTLTVADEHGVQFLIRNLSALDRHSRKLLDRFL